MSLKEISKYSSEELWKDVITVTKNAYVKELRETERPPTQNDFIDQIEHINSCLKYLKLIINYSVEKELYKFSDLEKKTKIDVVSGLILLCGEFSRENLWTTEISIKISKELLEQLCTFYNCDALFNILDDSNNVNLLLEIFKKIQPKITKDSYRKYPAAVSSYAFILEHIKNNMRFVLRESMPLVLILIDDFMVHNRIIGLNCLKNITQNVAKADLESYGDAEFLIKILLRLLYNLEPGILNPLISSLIAIIEKITSNKNLLQFQWTRYDDIYNILLPIVEMEQKIEFRSEYMSVLPTLIENSKISCLKWWNQFYNIFEEYCASEMDREMCLNVIYIFMKNTWPRLKFHCFPILLILVKALADLIHSPENSKEREKNNVAIKTTLSCIALLKLCAPEEVERQIKKFNEEDTLNAEFKLLLISA